MTLKEGMLSIDFTGAKNAFRFDEGNHILPNYHGLSHCMNAVDFIVEYADRYLFVEIKDPPDQTRYNAEQDAADLINNLVTKFRDTFLYRWAENKLDKPVPKEALCPNLP